MDLTLIDLWLPILASAVAVFTISSLFHLVIGRHRHDWKPVGDEDALLCRQGFVSVSGRLVRRARPVDREVFVFGHGKVLLRGVLWQQGHARTYRSCPVSGMTDRSAAIHRKVNRDQAQRPIPVPPRRFRPGTGQRRNGFLPWTQTR